MSESSLSTVVSSLVRASMGSAEPSTVTDEELDHHVAELILKEAKQKAERYMKDGVRAYLPDTRSEANVPKANKRFLSAIIRNTDDHNRTILRAQAEAAQEARLEKEEHERKERRARANEATEAERLRRLMGGSSRRHDDSWDRTRDSKRRRSSRVAHIEHEDHYNDESHDRRKRRRHSHSPSRDRRDNESDRHGRRRRDEEKRGEGSSRKHRRRSRSRSPDDDGHRSSRRHGRSRKSNSHEDREALKTSRDKSKEVEKQPTISSSSSRGSSVRDTPRASDSSKGSEEEPSEAKSSYTKHSRRPPSLPRKPSLADLSSQFQSRKAVRASPPPPASPTLSEEEDIERLRPRRHRRACPDPSSSTKVSHPDRDSRSPSPKPMTSKMDKYFKASYDPRLDTGPMTLPNVPSTGLIDNAEFESWDAMLEIIRQRREDKAEWKRLEKLGLLPDKKEKEKSSDAWSMEAGTGIMDIKYSKRGAVREWDMGKEGF